VTAGEFLAAAQEVEKLKPRLDELQETLDKTVSGMRGDTWRM